MPRRDALKVLPEATSADPEFRARFLREAELAARLSHPNVVAVYDRGVSEDCLWIAMQYVEGSDASTLVRGERLPPGRAVEIAAEVARGLDAAHAAGLLHRDVKPANILVAATGRVLLTDFGIARATAESTALTQTGDVLATVAYAAPEQLSGERVDERADVYALGGTLYHLLTGSAPFPRATPAAVLHAHLADPPPRPSTAVAGLPPQLDEVIARAMAKDPRDRFPSCGALAEAARAALHGQAPATPLPRRERTRVLLGSVLLALLLVVAAALAGAKVSGPLGRVAGAAVPLTTPAPTAADSGPWGAYSYIVAAFPALLPRLPESTGFRGLSCAPGLPNSDPAWHVSISVGPMTCTGDGDPLSALILICMAHRLPATNDLTLDHFIGTPTTRKWTKGSDTGQAWWGPAQNDAGNAVSTLVIEFDSPAHNSCSLQAIALNDSAQALYDSWWHDAPL